MPRNYLRLTYDSGDFTLNNLMGPNCELILQELMGRLPRLQYKRVMDLGCGRGLTSMLLAKSFAAQIFAVDLWMDPAENLERFKQFGLDEQIIPLYADAHDMPFAEGYFDLLISVDSYHYFGTEPAMLDDNIAPSVKSGGIIAVAVPGLKMELPEVPEEMKPFWNDEIQEQFHCREWWENLWRKSEKVELLESFSCACHKQAWDDWLRCKNPYAQGDAAMMKADDGKYFDTICLIARVK